MERILLAMMTAALWLPAAAWCGDEKDDNKLIDGKWIPIEAELGGQKFPDEIIRTMRLRISEGKYTVKVGEQLDKGDVKIEPKAKPKSMDITGTEGPNKGKSFPCIYELSGDTLRICYDLAGKERPTEFKTSKGTQQFLVTYKRE